MRILLDECVPWPTHRVLTNHSCTTVHAQEWGGIKNGDLLQRAETGFDLFITSDQNIRYQQNLAGRNIANLELSTNDIGRIQAAASLILATVEKISQMISSSWRFLETDEEEQVEKQLRKVSRLRRADEREKINQDSVWGSSPRFSKGVSKLMVIESVLTGVYPQCSEKIVKAEVGRQTATLIQNLRRLPKRRTITVTVVRYAKEVA